MTPKSHEISLSTTVFNNFKETEYIILEANNINVNDYILFKQVEIIDDGTKETGLFRMTQVKKIIEEDGLKDGYILVIVKEL